MAKHKKSVGLLLVKISLNTAYGKTENTDRRVSGEMSYGRKITQDIVNWLKSEGVIRVTYQIKKFISIIILSILVLNSSILTIYASNNNIDLEQKKRYPYSAECIIILSFKTLNGGTYMYYCTGQLVDKDKILTCGHEFKYSKEILYNDLTNADKTKNNNTVWKSRDELYKLEIDHYNSIVKQKELERQERIDSYLTTYDKFVLERGGKRERSSATDDYLASVSESNRVISERYPYQDGPARGAFVSPDELNNVVEKEANAIEEVGKQIEKELTEELDYRLAWEFPEFIGIEIDFLLDTKTQSYSTTGYYKIPKENVAIHDNYDFINSEYDLALIKTERDIGYTYGWVGLLSELKDNKKYSLDGYQEEDDITVFKNLSLTSRTGNFDNNIGIKSDLMYYYNLNTATGFSGAGLRIKSKYGDDYRVISIHKGKDEDGKAIGVRMTKDTIEWVISN